MISGEGTKVTFDVRAWLAELLDDDVVSLVPEDSAGDDTRVVRYSSGNVVVARVLLTRLSTLRGERWAITIQFPDRSNAQREFPIDETFTW